MIVLKLAWRNLIVRNRQTLILLLAISMGLFGLIFLEAFMDGFYLEMVNTVIDTDMGHIQVHEKDYLKKFDVELVIPDSDKVIREASATDHVTGVSPRILANGFFSSPESSNYGKVFGIDPRMEESVTHIFSKIVKGEKPTKGDDDKILIGEALAEKLKIDIGDKMVVQSKDITGSMSGLAFRVKGIYRTSSREYDKSNVYITTESARKLLSLEKNFHEIAIRVDEQKNVNGAAAIIADKVGNKLIKVETWEQLQPVLTQMIQMSKQMTWIFYLIVYIALAFGIVNAFMMEIFERIREFGIMMSLGVRPFSIFAVLMWESAILALASSFIGTGIAFIFIKLIMKSQMDLSIFGSGMSFLGLNSIIPLPITIDAIMKCSLSTIAAVVIATIYPAVRAMLFKPVEAVRHV